MEDQTWQAEQFEAHRAQLQAVAYRMLGSVSEAEDAVQEVWLRLSRSRDDDILNVGGWLTTVVGRICIDMLRARQARPVDFVGSWLPEPIVSTVSSAGPLGGQPQPDPEQEALLADSVGLAMLVVLETLTPAERLAFVLHDMFEVPFDQIGEMLDRSPAAARQLASRARQRVRGEVPEPDPDLGRQRQVVEAFLAAARAGDFDGLVALLHPDVVFRADTGGRDYLAPALMRGAPAVARQAATAGPRFAPTCRIALVNGGAGMVVMSRTGVSAVAGLTIVDGLVVEIDLILDRAKLAQVVVE